MSEELIIRHCSPTLAGIKTGNMFNCSFSNETELKENLRRLNKILVKKGLRIVPLRIRDNKALIYLFRPSHLDRDLKNDFAKKLLYQYGYTCEIPERCICKLINRIIENEDFPHEVGLFLGYPPEDVEGFINNKADGYKMVGTWKVYGNETIAKKIFESYAKCTEYYSAKLANGVAIETLAKYV